ncbi:hypothetical protein CASFOL_031617 [Castilleja foliolosa]|uniref:F-box domain-containing protein n=1 Tax=Castilleja foliolosa TaxID=1961234 RepID=A0ABD3C674_9LAMI
MADKEPKIFEGLLEEILENEGLRMEVLVRLPAEDLTRYKLVCKDWRDLIESPNFVSAHLNHSKRNPSRHHILFQCDTLHPLKSAINFCWPDVIVVGCINGLICVADFELPDYIWILNPITGNAIELPLSGVLTDYDTVTLAFWWDCVTGVYKVLKVTSKCDKNGSDFSCIDRPVDSNSVELWDSSNPDIWSEIPMGFHRPFYHGYHGSGRVTRCDVVIGMYCYWYLYDSYGCDAFILSFNMKTQVLKQISLPSISIPTDPLTEYLFESRMPNFFGANWNGNFALVGKGKICAGMNYYNVWTLDVCGVWSEKFCFHLDSGIHSFINCIDATLVLQRDDDGRVVFYNTENQKCFFLGKKGLYEMETRSEDRAMVVYKLAEGCSDSVEDYPYSFNQFQMYGLGLHMGSTDDEVDDDLACTYAESVDVFVGSLLTIDGFKPLLSENDMVILPSVVGNTNSNQHDEQITNVDMNCWEAKPWEAEQWEAEQDFSSNEDFWDDRDLDDNEKKKARFEALKEAPLDPVEDLDYMFILPHAEAVGNTTSNQNDEQGEAEQDCSSDEDFLEKTLKGLQVTNVDMNLPCELLDICHISW